MDEFPDYYDDGIVDYEGSPAIDCLDLIHYLDGVIQGLLDLMAIDAEHERVPPDSYERGRHDGSLFAMQMLREVVLCSLERYADWR